MNNKYTDLVSAVDTLVPAVQEAIGVLSKDKKNIELVSTLYEGVCSVKSLVAGVVVRPDVRGYKPEEIPEFM